MDENFETPVVRLFRRSKSGFLAAYGIMFGGMMLVTYVGCKIFDLVNHLVK